MSNMPQSRGMRSFLPRKPRERFHRITVQRKEYFVLLLFFDLFRRSSCLVLIGQMLLKMSPRLYYPHVEPASKERSERHVERKWYRSVQRYPRNNIFFEDLKSFWREDRPSTERHCRGNNDRRSRVESQSCVTYRTDELTVRVKRRAETTPD